MYRIVIISDLCKLYVRVLIGKVYRAETFRGAAIEDNEGVRRFNLLILLYIHVRTHHRLD